MQQAQQNLAAYAPTRLKEQSIFVGVGFLLVLAAAWFGFRVIKVKIVGPSISNIFLAMRVVIHKESFLKQNFFHRLSIILHNILYHLFNWFISKISRGGGMFVVAVKESL